MVDFLEASERQAAGFFEYSTALLNFSSHSLKTGSFKKIQRSKKAKQSGKKVKQASSFIMIR